VFNRKYSPYLFTAPFAIMFLVFWVWPIAQSLIWSTLDWDGIRKAKFVGLRNYVALFREPVFLQALGNTIAAAIVYIALLVVLSFLIAIALNSDLLFGRTVFRSAFFAPVTVSLPVVALIFMIIYTPHNGVLNKICALFGAPPETDWLGNPRTALGSIVALRLWRAAGYYSVFVLAGLQAIPRETIEASLIDGASPVQRSLYVVLPQLKPVLVYVAIASSVWAFQLFEEPWILTEGGPANATSTVGIHIYTNGFKFFKLGYASASAYLLAMVILGFALLQLGVTRERRAT
jgi:ABC-type sugar transport system permease subunit